MNPINYWIKNFIRLVLYIFFLHFLEVSSSFQELIFIGPFINPQLTRSDLHNRGRYRMAKIRSWQGLNSYITQLYFGFWFMRKASIFRLKHIDGESHFVLQNHNEPSSKGKKYSEIEAIKASKQEAVKPLLLIREWPKLVFNEIATLVNRE